tara:strand:- start:17 stop:1117 length:1101 start_codon:yes stop_codon:yes gene_type:complete
MGKIYTALGFMSGTSGDGIDASIIKSDGKNEYEVIANRFYKYSPNTSSEILKLKDCIQTSLDLSDFSKEIHRLDQNISFHHFEATQDMKKFYDFDLIGFHGQTILHLPEEGISKQIGSGEKLSLLTKRTVVYNFRENDLVNGGQGAPLAPIFHKLLVKQNKIKLPVTILNIGGISNITSINDKFEILSADIGPGNCLIDRWMRLNSDKTFDKDGSIARSGKVDKFIVEQKIDRFKNHEIRKKKSFDINDFWFVLGLGEESQKNLTLENGAATLTEITSEILSQNLKNKNIYTCGGGRKNKFLIESIEKKIEKKIKLIDEIDIDGDFVESQAFAFLAIRSYLGLPISFPGTTGCKKPCTGGVIVKSF